MPCDSAVSFPVMRTVIMLLSVLATVSCWAGESTTWTGSLSVPATPPLVFPRTQCHKYWAFQNYLHWWNDRPLLTDRSLRPAVVDGNLVTPGSELVAIKASMVRDAELAKLYAVDGLGSFGNTSYQQPAYGVYLDALAENSVTGYKHLLEVGNDLADLTYLRLALTKALASPYAARINGKILVTSYALDRYGPSNIASRLATLRGEFGNTFVLVVEMTGLSEAMRDAYVAGTLSTAPSANLNAVKSALRQYLDATDGFMVENCHHMEMVTTARYDNRFNLAFYRDCLIPIFKSVLAEPAYTGKLFGLGAVSGYVNARTGDNNSEECTRRLRNSLQTAINAAPHFIVMSEWNEQNENTSLQPTVSNSWTHQRIIEYFMRKAKGLALVQHASDDTTIPNCIVSYRKNLKVGETLEVELLNVPDSSSSDAYTATLSLQDPAGNVLKTFLPASFVRNVLSDTTFTIASETLWPNANVRPVVTIQQATAPTTRTFSDGLRHVSLHPTWTYDYQTVKQPLRDLATLSIASLQVTSTSGRDVTLSGNIVAGEPLASVEIIDGNDDEVWAYDQLNEYDLANNMVIYGYHTFLPGSAGFDCDISVSNSSFQFKQVWMPEAFRQYQKIGDIIRFPPTSWDNQWPGRFYVLIPKANQNTAIINITSSKGSFSVRVADILSQGVFSKTLISQFVMRFERFDVLADHPVPINANSATFTATIHAATESPTYHLRIITQSGRIWRSMPVLVPLAVGTPTVQVNVSSESQAGAAVAIAVPRRDLLDLSYQFDPRCGDVLPVTAGPRWFAQLGGGTLYADPFYANYAGYPASAPLSKPAWAVEDGSPSLRFSGDGQYLVLPTEAFPRGAFRLACEIKPMASTPQILFRHHGIQIGSLMLKLTGGLLYASYVDKLAQETGFDTGLSVPVGQWSRIVVSYDLVNLTFQVDGQTPRIFPFSGRALYFNPSVFGGHLRPTFGVAAGDGFFNGFLKSLRITHDAEVPPLPNTTPMANAQAKNVAAGVATTITLTGSDVDGDALTMAVTTLPTHGTLSGMAPLLTYTPYAGFLGADSFTFTVNDGLATSVPAALSITVAVLPVGESSGTVSASGTGTGSGAEGEGSGGGCGLGGVAGLLLVACLGLRRRALPGVNES